MSAPRYLGIDIGGTFTDLVAYDPQSAALTRSKVLTTPADPSLGVMAAIEAAGVPLAGLANVKHGTTLAINTVIERRGGRTALVTTRGFRDVLELGRGNRPQPFNLMYKRVAPVVPRNLVFEVGGRMSGQGQEIEQVEQVDLERLAGELAEANVDAVAVFLMNSYVNPHHEEMVGDYLRERLDVFVTESTRMTREWREFERATTAAVNAYTGPKLSRYIGALDERLDKQGFRGQFYMMESNGGAMSADAAREAPVKLLESGPVAGVVGAARLCDDLQLGSALSFDMGGTTAKCALVSGGRIETVSTYYVGGYEAGCPVLAPVVDIVEVGAGGGSIAWIDEVGALNVGPRSAGADPGPVCYRLGGTEPTVTDANAVLGHLPVVSGVGGPEGLDVDGARTAIAQAVAGPLDLELERAADGILQMADTIMASAVRRITVERGLDPREFTLVASGGAGPLHALSVAAELGIGRVVVPPGPGHFSAWGMLLADIRHEYALTRRGRLTPALMRDIAQDFARLERDAAEEMRRECPELLSMRLERFADMRFQGQEHTVRVALKGGEFSDADEQDTMDRFRAAYRTRFGRSDLSSPIEIVTIRVVSEGIVEKPGEVAVPEQTERRWKSCSSYFRGHGWVDTTIVDRASCAIGTTLEGPTIVVEDGATTLLPPGSSATLDDRGNLVATVRSDGNSR